MMKKFVVLTLLLAMASLASAGLEVVINQDDAAKTGVITVNGEDITGMTVAIAVDSADVSLIWDNVSYPTAFDLPGKVQGQNAQYGEVTISNIFSPGRTGTIADGIAYDFSALTQFPAILTVTDVIDPGNPEVLMVHEIVPEPMTFALLGLGGLFLRRRK